MCETRGECWYRSSFYRVGWYLPVGEWPALLYLRMSVFDNAKSESLRTFSTTLGFAHSRLKSAAVFTRVIRRATQCSSAAGLATTRHGHAKRPDCCDPLRICHAPMYDLLTYSLQFEHIKRSQVKVTPLQRRAVGELFYEEPFNHLKS